MDGRRKDARREAAPAVEPGLRERKAAATRIAIACALRERLAKTALSDISADELAADANVSRMTFFNYFPTKEHAVDLLMLVWLFEIDRELTTNRLRGTRAIERVFTMFGDEVAAAPGCMKRVLAHFAARPIDRPMPELDRAEQALLSRGKGGEGTVLPSLGALFMRALDEAIQDGELELVGSTYEMAHYLGSLANGAALVGHSSADTDWRNLYRRHAKRALGTLGPGPRGAGPGPKIPARYRTHQKRGTHR